MTLNPFHDARQRAREKDAALTATENELAEFQAKADAREPHVNKLFKWAMDRRMSNGVGADFEFDLSNPRRFGAHP